MALQTVFDQTTFSVGDTIKVTQKIKEGDKIRTQPFQGIVIAIKGRDENKMFTVRKIATGQIGVERIFPLYSPWIEKIEVVRKGRVRRAKLYYLRQRKGKEAVKVKTIKEKPKAKKKKPKKKVVSEKKKTRPTRRKTSRKPAKKE